MLHAQRGIWRRSFWSSVPLAIDACRQGAFQKSTELAALLALLGRLRPQAVLEIGAGAGGTLYAWCRVAASDATIVSVDLPGGPFGGEWAGDQERLQRHARPEQTLHLIALDSHDPQTSAEVAVRLDGRPVDFLFIDGDHTYEGVRCDYVAYAPLVRPGGVIAFHDIVDGPPELVGDVPRFWREADPSSGSRLELVESWAQGGFGLGVLRLPDEPG
ncbi:MAG TPA: class I SAM-dependent methyltransferase [Gaiellaceae bacterium]|jgi:cephalosporin hydroxylase